MAALLENARKRYANLLKQGRQDVIAKIVLARVQQEINELEREQHELTERQESIKHRHTNRATRHIEKGSNRERTNGYGSDRAIYPILTAEAV